MAMDAKDLGNDTSVGNSDGSKYSDGGSLLQFNRNKHYQDMESTPLGKVDGAPSRPCAVIGPDRVMPRATPEGYPRKPPKETWSVTDNPYSRPPEYPYKILNYQNPVRNISPRQTFQENMQRIMVQPRYNAANTNEDPNYATEKSMMSKNVKLSMPPEAKYCDVPYTVNHLNSDQKNMNNTDLSTNPTNPAMVRNGGWPPSGVGLRPARPYGLSDMYQYPEYQNCAVSGPTPIMRPLKAAQEETGPIYTEGAYYNERFKPYPSVKERYPPPRYEYVNKTYQHPHHSVPVPFPTHKYDFHKNFPPHSYPGYPQMPIKYMDGRLPESIIDGYHRQPNQHSNYNLPVCKPVIHPSYGPVQANLLQNKIYPYPPDNSVKAIIANKSLYDNKMFEYENSLNKMYHGNDNPYTNEMPRSHIVKNQVMPPNYPLAHGFPPHSYYRKDPSAMRNYEYFNHLRNMDPNLCSPMARYSAQFSPNTISMSPSESSNTSNDTVHTQGTSLEDYGYVSQSSAASIRSMDSCISRFPADPYRRYDYRSNAMVHPNHLFSKTDSDSKTHSSSKNKKDLNVRQFLQMWNEGEEDNSENKNEDANVQVISSEEIRGTKQYQVGNHQDQLYVLDLVNVPSEELDKYDHIQKVSKLPENIKGYNSIELLDQFEEAISSSNLNQKFNPKTSRDDHLAKRINRPVHATIGIPRPVSPLDVESKISQSVIHKEVGCNFEIKPCSPKMLSADVAAPVQKVLGERTIEKVSNPDVNKYPVILHTTDENNANNNDNLHVPCSENLQSQSCQMINTQYNSEESGHARENYNLHDFENNSSVCLASLPRLDSDIELNFTEVNQQFVNANKNELKDLPPLGDLDSTENVEKGTVGQSLPLNFALNSPNMECENEFLKLSKFRKSKKISSKTKDIQASRTDSVIIKNPDNTVNYEHAALSASTDTDSSNEKPVDSENALSGLEYEVIQEIKQHKGIEEDLSLSNDVAINFSVHTNKNNVSEVDNNVELKIDQNFTGKTNHYSETSKSKHAEKEIFHNDVSIDIEDYSSNCILKNSENLTDVRTESTIVEEIATKNMNESQICKIMPCDNSLYAKDQMHELNDTCNVHLKLNVDKDNSEHQPHKIDIYKTTCKINDQKSDFTELTTNILDVSESIESEVKTNLDENYTTGAHTSLKTSTNSCFEKSNTDIIHDVELEKCLDSKKTDDIKINKTSNISLNDILTPIHCETKKFDSGIIKSESQKNINENYENVNCDKMNEKLSNEITVPDEDKSTQIENDGLISVRGFKNEVAEEQCYTIKGNEKIGIPGESISRLDPKDISDTYIALNSDFVLDEKSNTQYSTFLNTSEDEKNTSEDEKNMDLKKESKQMEMNVFQNFKQPVEFEKDVELINLSKSSEMFSSNFKTVFDTFITSTMDVKKYFNIKMFCPWIQKLLISETGPCLSSNNLNFNENNKDLLNTMQNVYLDGDIVTKANEGNIIQESIVNLNEKASIVSVSELENAFVSSGGILDAETYSNDFEHKDKNALGSMSIETRELPEDEIGENKNDFAWVDSGEVKKETSEAELITTLVIAPDLNTVKNNNLSAAEIPTSNNWLGECKKLRTIPENDINNVEKEIDLTVSKVSENNNKPLVNTITTNEIKSFCNTIIPTETQTPVKKLKRSLSESSLHLFKEHSDDWRDFSLSKHAKKSRLENELQKRSETENICKFFHANRRNSVSTMYTDESVSFCILIDENCIISEECDNLEKISYAEVTEECITEIRNSDAEHHYILEETSSHIDEVPVDSIEESWVEDVACVETVLTDDIAEDVVISASSSPNIDDYSGYESNNDCSDINNSDEVDVMDQVRYIYGGLLCNDDAQFVETLYHTPQMDVKKTLIDKESHSIEETNDSSDESFILNNSPISMHHIDTDCIEKDNSCPITEILNQEINEEDLVTKYSMLDNTENAEKVIRSFVKTDIESEKYLDDILGENICESSVDSVFPAVCEESPRYTGSSSPEVSSTTSEEKCSGILLKITNLKGSRISQINNNSTTEKKFSCKFTEKSRYSSSGDDYTGPLLTKAAQKYIPPLKEQIADLKVKLPLPQQSLMKLKLLKISKDKPKPDFKIIKMNDKLNNRNKEIIRKPKPKFEDVLKSIDETNLKKLKEKSKKSKKSVPKVFIKKNENGSHYASTSRSDDYNPDLTGRKWQPWVFLEKNNFIDKMAIKRKTKAIFNYRKNTFMLAEKFYKYKSSNSTKFVINHPKVEESSQGQLKYTIRLKHSY